MTWGYTVFKATPETDWQRHCTMNARGHGFAGKCNLKTGYVTRYYYTTGNTGRVSSNDRWVCEDHARRFAAKHGIEISEQREPRRLTDQERARHLIHSVHQEPNT